MLKRTITYEDFNGEKQTDVVYFNLSTAELVELEVEYEGGLNVHMQAIIDAKDYKALVKEFKNLLLMSYGEKTADGKKFVKSPELSAEFAQTAAYDALFVDLATNTEAAVKFMEGILPKSLQPDQDKPILPPPSPTTVDI